MSNTACIVMFARAPALGQVKTRLARDFATALSPAQAQALALAFHKAFGLDMVEQFRMLVHASPTVELTIHCTPPTGVESIAAWLGADLRIRPQASPQSHEEADGMGDLGARMAFAIEQVFMEEQGVERVVLLGSDIPEVQAPMVADALAQLADGSADMALGPAEDGGFYCVGFDRCVVTQSALRAVFRDVAWGEPTVFAQTMARAETLGLRVTQPPRLHDMDRAADLLGLLERWPEDDGPETPAAGEHAAGPSRTLALARASRSLLARAARPGALDESACDAHSLSGMPSRRETAKRNE